MPLQWMEKLVEFYALLKRDVPHLIKVHWIAHSLELAFLDTVKAVLQLKEAKGMLQVIRKHYHYSAKAVRELKELARCMQMKACKKVKADGTRLVLHLKRALDIPLLKNYYPAETHLQHTSQARDVSVTTQDRASNYCRKLVSYKFLFFLHMLLDIVRAIRKLLDIVTAIRKLSLQFLDDKISISQHQDKVNTRSSTLEAFKVRPGENLTSLQRLWGW